MYAFSPLKPRLPLLALGTFATACIAMSGAYTWQTWPMSYAAMVTVRTIGWTLAIVLFFWVLQSVRQGLVLTTRYVLLGSVALAAPFLLVQPVFAGDLYAYVANAKVALLGNPYVLTPSVLGNDAILSGVAPAWQHVPTAYGPLWTLVSRALATITSDPVALAFTFRVLALAGVLGVGWLLCRHASPARAALLAWNPIVLVEAVGDGHHDVLVGLALLYALVAMQKQVRSGLALAAATAMKFVPFLAVPMLIACQPEKQRLRTVGWYTALIVGTLVVLFAPFWVGSQTFNGVQAQAKLFSLPLFFPQFFVFTLSAWLGSAVHPEVLARSFGLALFFTAYVGVLWAAWRRKLAAAGAVALTLATYLFFAAPYAQTWYLLWLLPVLGLLDRRNAVRWVGVASVVWVAMLVLIPR